MLTRSSQKWDFLCTLRHLIFFVQFSCQYYKILHEKHKWTKFLQKIPFWESSFSVSLWKKKRKGTCLGNRLEIQRRPHHNSLSTVTHERNLSTKQALSRGGSQNIEKCQMHRSQHSSMPIFPMLHVPFQNPSCQCNSKLRQWDNMFNYSNKSPN